MGKNERRKYISISVFAVCMTIFIGFTLSRFYKDIQQRIYSKQMEVMEAYSMQGSAVVEKQLEGLVNALYGLAEYLQEEDIDNDANINGLGEFLKKRDIGFQRMGVADAEGNAKVTNGEALNISDRKYFQRCMKEKRGVSEIRQSELVDKPVCIIAVPIPGKYKEPIGVLYGVMEIGVFDIYKNTVLENEKNYIQIVDMDGNYILKEASGLIGKKDNIFDGIRCVESQKSAEEIRKRIRNEEQVYTELTDGKAHEIAYFTPLKLNEWCVVTVIDYSEIVQMVDYILDNDVYIMILKVVGSLFLLFILITYFSWQERKKIFDYNERLMLDEKIVKIASEKAGFAILSYDVKSKELRFINNAHLGIEFPKCVENAPKEFVKYISSDKELRNQVEEIFASIEQGGEKRRFPLTYIRDGQKIYLKLQLIINEKNGEVQNCIGVLEDYTEEVKLRDKADRDSLTGLYNRNGAIERIENYLKSSELHTGTSHACIIFDVDNFKLLNDTLGHQMGDRALQDIADILKRHFRNYDIVCRLGGDEFLVFVKNIPKDAIDRNMTSLMKKLELTYEKDKKSVNITASAGIACVSDLTMSIREMYRRADEALYQVKNDAKNGFRIYGK